jgi:hypothetical protein
MAFLGVDEKKLVDAALAGLGVGTARSLLVEVLTDLVAGKCLHVVASVGDVKVDCKVSLEDL